MAEYVVVLHSGGRGIEVFGPFECLEYADKWAAEKLKGHAWESVLLQADRKEG